MGKYKAFLSEIGYLVPEGDYFSVWTDLIYDEIALIVGPQLVVSIINARYVLNVRWGSLYHNPKGTDALS
jgi:malate synthase|tara:strand:- start:191 stop:400 length:210 start_codon:yes stop_codon:yes gene_type:complete